MEAKLTVKDFIVITKAAYKKSELSTYITVLHLIFFVGMFIEPKSGITGFVLCILIQLMNLIIGTKELTDEEIMELDL